MSEIEEKKLLDALAKAKDADIVKAQFIANMSHEIRTPLNSIIGLVTLLQVQEDMDEKKRKDYYKIIRESGEFLLSIIDEMLIFSKLGAKKFHFNPVKFNFLDTIDDIRARFEALAKAKSLDFSFKIDKSIPEELISDPVLLKHILGNLLMNAVKYTKSGYISFSISIDEITKKGYRLLMRIKDTGIGIAKENQEKIFSSFFQVDGSNTREFGGTGLGLAIVREMTELINGKLRTNSNLGKGSEFYFSCDFQAVN